MLRKSVDRNYVIRRQGVSLWLLLLSVSLFIID